MERVAKFPAPAAESTPQPDLFAAIGLHGLAGIAPVLLAALATEEPLLLIGAHGTGKSLLLTRIAGALGLRFRHYNASLLNFDDLVGFPVPGKAGTLEYLKTPAAIWGAEVVFFDEISRCRPDVQNKIFPVVHERRVQGLALEGLRFRWAAMNPPVTDEDPDQYIGSEPLDAALADRFAFVVDMPGWEQLTAGEQLRVIRGEGSEVSAAGSAALRNAVSRAHGLIAPLEASLASGLGEYLRTLAPLLGTAGIRLSPRRMRMLFRTAIGVHAAAISLDTTSEASDSVLLALRHGIPQRAEGHKVLETAILAAHKEAWRLAAVRPDDPLKAVLMATDPIERVRVAVLMKDLRKMDFSGVVAEALARLPAGAREAAVVHVFETGAVGRLTAAVAEQAARIYAHVATPLELNMPMHASRPEYRAWQRIKDILSRLDPADPREHLCANALASCYSRKEILNPDAAETAFMAFKAADARLTGRTSG